MASTNKQSWYTDAIFYELNIRAFKDSTGDGHGDFRGAIQKLDYLTELGIDCLWLLPFYPSPLKDDGYDVADYCNIDPRFGTLEDFDDFIKEVHRRGMRVITDLVVNHTSDQHPWFIESRASRDNPKRDWYVWRDDDQSYQDVRIIFQDTETSNWAYDALTKQYYWHRFYSSQPDLNFDNPDVQDAMLDVMCFWLEKGIDGFRLDAVPYLYERDGTNCESLPETHAYLKRMRRIMTKQWPEAIMLCEANQPPEEMAAYFGDSDECHMSFHFPLMPRLFMSLQSGNETKLREIIEQTPPLPADSQWCTFLRNHDELTLEMVTAEERQWMLQEYAPDPQMRMNLGIRRRLAPLLDNDPLKIMSANRLLFSLPGATILYYGDEIGMGDDLNQPDRNGVRTPMQWDTSINAGFSDAPLKELYTPAIADPVYGYSHVNVDTQRNDPSSLLNQMRSLIALRKSHPVFAVGSLEFIDTDNRSVITFLRTLADINVLVLHNLSDKDEVTHLRLPQYAGQNPYNLLNREQTYPLIGSGQSEFRIAPYQSLWLLLKKDTDT